MWMHPSYDKYAVPKTISVAPSPNSLLTWYIVCSYCGKDIENFPCCLFFSAIDKILHPLKVLCMVPAVSDVSRSVTVWKVIIPERQRYLRQSMILCYLVVQRGDRWFNPTPPLENQVVIFFHSSISTDPT